MIKKNPQWWYNRPLWNLQNISLASDTSGEIDRETVVIA